MIFKLVRSAVHALAAGALRRAADWVDGADPLGTKPETKSSMVEVKPGPVVSEEAATMISDTERPKRDTMPSVKEPLVGSLEDRFGRRRPGLR